MKTITLSQAIKEAIDLQKQYETLKDNPQSQPADINKAKKAWDEAQKLLEDLKEEEAAKSAPAKITGAIVDAVKAQLMTLAPQVKDLKDKKKLVPDKNYVDAVNRLNTSNCTVASSNGNVHVVNAGPFGVRKVTVE